jgi:hypothetical protein
MGSKSGGGFKITNWRKVKSGYDQEFTLPKGTSAAPIKQVKVTTEVQRVKAQIAKDKVTPKNIQPKGKVVGKVRQNWGEWKPVHQKVKKPWDLTLKDLQKKSIVKGNSGDAARIAKWKKYIRGE